MKPTVPGPAAKEPAETSPVAESLATARGLQSGPDLTTSQGVRLPDTDHSLKAGPRGPTLLEDFHLREKITHFDHERIPERVVHARGAGAYGTFTAYGSAASVTSAGFLAEKGRETEVFARFSTVLGSRGSADTVRDVRGFAVKFYTAEGNFDLVGNNMPVFFIQDAIKFPDLIHAAKWHPDREIPQAQTAHDTFWDFVSLHTEATHMVLWAMSDRGIPRSYRTMEGFGVHTFRLVNVDGTSSLVKFHWKPVAGVHSLAWEEAQLTAGFDPDFHRRDLADSIDAGLFFEYELGIQVLPDTDDETFEGIDLLDPTKLVPEELAPVQPVGKLTLNRNPDNFHAETEQIAFHIGNLVPGIEVTNDPLLQGRLFSYLDTQLSRLGGPNFTQLPVNRAHAPVNDNLRDGIHQSVVHQGIAPYLPNSLAGADGPVPAGAQSAEARPGGEAGGGYVNLPEPVDGPKIRANPVSFSDHYSQAALFYASLSPIEQGHVAEAITFELSKLYEQPIRERVLEVLANVDTELTEQVAAGLGLPAPVGKPPAEVTPSPALAQIDGRTWPVAGRIVGVIGTADTDVSTLQRDLKTHGVVVRLIAPTGGDGVERTFQTARSVEFDTVLVTSATTDPRVAVLLQEAYRHAKPIGVSGDGVRTLTAAGIDATAPGILPDPGADQIVTALAAHRVWDRVPLLKPPVS
ncbi:catalase [Actinoplanes derwentensis]|uniref:Catalase n=1 Tax=Actinoplanes derwentensis TaxID=113562 RepID=A0A1H2ABQ4_9ACTN|nr:catalase [Actinoplanes derwentensis]GID88918.1 catalase [Actinoplanes derwentensis]SDT42916.1 catalase [Actinoplanes derwentensis]